METIGHMRRLKSLNLSENDLPKYRNFVIINSDVEILDGKDIPYQEKQFVRMKESRKNARLQVDRKIESSVHDSLSV